MNLKFLVFRALLDINEKTTNILILNIMIVASIETSTINFIAPLVFNVDNGTVAQVVLDANQYPDFWIDGEYFAIFK